MAIESESEINKINVKKWLTKWLTITKSCGCGDRSSWKKKMTNFSTSDKFTIIHYSISNFILPLLYYYIQRTVLHHCTCVVTRLGSCSSNAKIPGRFPWLADWFHLFSRYPTWTRTADISQWVLYFKMVTTEMKIR